MKMKTPKLLTIKNATDALAGAMILAITAPTMEQARRANKLVHEMVEPMSKREIENAKRRVLDALNWHRKKVLQEL
jgi:hypothetical protein